MHMAQPFSGRRIGVEEPGAASTAHRAVPRWARSNIEDARRASCSAPLSLPAPGLARRRLRRGSREAVLFGYCRRGAVAFPAVGAAVLPGDIGAPSRWSLSLVEKIGPRESDPVRRDQARMTLIAAGDEASFAALMGEESPRLLRFAASILGRSDGEAEEVVQEAMLRLWRHAVRWEPGGRVATWLHRVVYHLAIDALRRRRPSVTIESVEDLLSDAEAPAEERLIRAEDMNALRAAVEALPARQRTAIALCHFQGLSQVEAAAVMEVSEAAYESLLARARRRLRSRLAGRGGDGDGDRS